MTQKLSRCSIKLIYLVMTSLARPNQPVISNTVMDGDVSIPGVEDHYLNITCTSTGGYPRPYMAWFKTSNRTASLVDNSDMIIRPDRTYTLTYTFKPTRADEGALFICQTSFDRLPFLYMDDKAILYLNYHPTITLSNGETVNEGDPTSFTCEANSKPYPTFTWYHNDATFSIPSVDNGNLSVLTIPRVNRIHSGKFRCQAVNGYVPYGMKDTDLIVKYKPITVELIANTVQIVANGNNRVNLTCTSGSSYPKSTIKWYKNNEGIQANATIYASHGENNGLITSQMLDFVAERDMDGDLIYCTVHNNINIRSPIYSANITLDLMFHPIATISAEDVVIEGNNMTVQCNVNSKPESTLSLSHNGTSLQSGTRVSSNVYVSTIVAVSRNQAGTYKCLADNGHLPKGNSQTNLAVHYKPDVTVSTKNVTVNDRSTEIICIPSGIPSVYTYSEWTHYWKGQVIVQHQHGLGKEPTLTLSNLTYAYSGVYECRVDNGIQYSLNPNAGQGTAYLEVETFPIIITPGTIHIHASLNNPTIVSITFYSNIEVNVVECLRNNVKIDCPTNMAERDIQLPVFGTYIATKGIIADIVLTLKSMDHFGIHNVQITNVIGSSKMVIVDVKPEGPPETPSDVQIDEVLFNYVTMSWMPSCHGGFNQTFVIEYSRDGKEWLPEDKVERQGWQLEQRINGTISNLKEQCRYYFRIRSHNERGFSKYTDIFNVTTEAYQGGVANTSSNNPIIAGAVTAGCIFVIALSIGALYWIRRRQRGNSQHSETSKTRRDAPNTAENSTERIQDYYNIDRNPYEDLRHGNEDVHAYGTLNIFEGSSNQPNGNTVYENLKLSRVK